MLFDLDAYVNGKDVFDNRLARNDRGTILLAEDDHELRRFLVVALTRAGYAVTQCVTGTELLEQLSSYIFLEPGRGFDLIVTDIRMPGLTALEILEGLQRCRNLPPVILITAFGDEETHAQAHALGAAAIFDKPFDFTELLERIRVVLQQKAA